MNTFRIHFVDASGEEFTYYGEWASEELACVATWTECGATLITLVELVK